MHHIRWQNWEVIPSHTVLVMETYSKEGARHLFAPSAPFRRGYFHRVTALNQKELELSPDTDTGNLENRDRSNRPPGGASLPIRGTHGDWGYASYPPGGLLLIWAATGFTKEPTVKGLRLQSAALGVITAILLGIAAYRLTGGNPWAAGVAALIYSVSTETLHAHGTILWGQHWTQIVIAAGAIALTLPQGAGRTVTVALLAAGSFWVEWTGFLFAPTIIAAEALLRANSPVGFIKAAVPGGLTVGISGMGFLLYHHVLYGLENYLPQILSRARVRGVGVDYYSWGDWLTSINISAGPWIWLGTAALIWVLAAKTSKLEKLACATLWLPCIITIAMMEHSIVYSLANLKWVSASALTIALASTRVLEWKKVIGPILVTAVLFTGCLMSWNTFQKVHNPSEEQMEYSRELIKYREEMQRRAAQETTD